MRSALGFSLIELLIVVVIIGIVAALAIPNLLASRRAANEASAIASLRVLHGATMSYAATSGGGNFAGQANTPGTSSLTDLYNSQLIDQVLSTGTKGSYTFVGDRSPESATSPQTFYFAANPIGAAFALSGTRRFGVATDGVIRFDSTAANLAMPLDAAALSSAVAVPLNN
jgi:prepilin-type N-terminal cleavage/methylation domain-containing protein